MTDAAVNTLITIGITLIVLRAVFGIWHTLLLISIDDHLAMQAMAKGGDNATDDDDGDWDDTPEDAEAMLKWANSQ